MSLFFQRCTKVTLLPATFSVVRVHNSRRHPCVHMKVGRPQVGIALLLSLLGFAASVQLALGKKKEKTAAAAGQMDQRKQAVHLLNRLTFGPRPGDVDRVM